MNFYELIPHFIDRASEISQFRSNLRNWRLEDLAEEISATFIYTDK